MDTLLRQALWGATGIVSMAAATPAVAQVKLFNIPAQDAASAISVLGRQADVQIAASRRDTRGKRTRTVTGSMTVDQALNKMLSGTGLTAQATGAQTYTVVPLVDAGDSAGGDSSEDRDIVVTGEKLGGKQFKDTPVPIATIPARALTETGKNSLLDYYSTLPGLSLNPDSQNRVYYSIRGISPGRASIPTVGTAMDEVPLGASLGAQGSATDLDPSDLASIDVLRGPQGTLYGANAMGGLINFRTVDPQLGQFKGRVLVSGGLIQQSKQVNYGFSGSVNIPIGDTLAIRASAHARRTAGYIDDPSLGKEDVNGVDDRGGLVKVLFEPSDKASITLTANYQDKIIDGYPQSDLKPGLLDMQQRRGPVDEHGKNTIELYSARASVTLGPVKLTSITAYQHTEYSDVLNFQETFAFFQAYVPGSTENRTTEGWRFGKISQEVRADVQITPQAKLLVGYFYQHEDYKGYQNVDGLDSTGRLVGNIYTTGGFDIIYREHAAFTNFSYDVTPKFNVELGGRYSWVYTGQPVANYASGPYYTPARRLPGPSASLRKFTWSVTPRYKFSDDAMLYARVATGYRPGGGNNLTVTDVPPTYGSDTITNYEIGFKGDIRPLDLSVDLSVFYIDWKGIQVQVNRDAGLRSFRTNGGGAKSQGVEVSLNWRPTPTWSIDAWFSYTDSVLTQNFPEGTPLSAKPGDRTPFSMEVSGNFSARKSFPLPGGAEAFISGAANYVGNRFGNFVAPGVTRLLFPSYVKTDFSAGVDFGGTALRLFVNNAFDERGVISKDHYVPTRYTFIQPRTIGVSIDHQF